VTLSLFLERSYALSVWLGVAALLANCAFDSKAHPPPAGGDDWGDEALHPELGGAFSGLTAARGACVFTANSGALAIALDGTAQTVIVGGRVVDALLVINGDSRLCTDSVTHARTSVPINRIKTLAITDTHASNAQNVVLDFLAGTFGVGAKGKVGISVALAGGNDTLAIRGTSGKDQFAAGSTGIAAGAKGFSINADSYVDIDMLQVEKLSVSLAKGDDSFSGAGVFGTGGAYPGALTVFGGADRDSLTGGNGDDLIHGGEGDDALSGAAGADSLSGDAGDDTILQGADPDGSDIIVCGEGYKDRVSYALRGDVEDGDVERVTVTVGTRWWDHDDDPSTPDVPARKNDGDSASDERDDVGTSCEVLLGGMGDDTLTGDDSTTKGHANDVKLRGDTIYGGPGRDRLSGGLGNDTLYGEAGDDTFDETRYGDADEDDILDITYDEQGSTGADTFVGGDGVDTVDYSARTAAIRAAMDGDIRTILTIAAATTTAKNDGETGEFDNVISDVENLHGGSGADVLTGNALSNLLRGGAGDDELVGLAGDDSFDERSGWDVSALDATHPVAEDDSLSSGDDELVGGDGTDTVDYSLRSVALDVDMIGNAQHASKNDGATGLESDDVHDDVENILGGLAANTIVGNDRDNVLIGGPAADDLKGGEGADALYGLGGDDTLDGGDGDDRIYGGDDQLAAYTTCGPGADMAFSAVVVLGDVSCEQQF
jgi:Ca2+-binding RTX toxin-like protein